VAAAMIAAVFLVVLVETMSIVSAGLTHSTDTSKELLRWLYHMKAAKYDYSIYRALADNSNIPPSVLERLSEIKDDNIRNRFATPRELFFHDFRTVRERIAENPCTPEAVLRALSAEGLEHRVLRNPLAPKEILLQAGQHKSKEIRRLVAENPNTPETILERLAREKDAYVRWGVVVNPNVSKPLLESFAEDEALRGKATIYLKYRDVEGYGYIRPVCSE